MFLMQALPPPVSSPNQSPPPRPAPTLVQHYPLSRNARILRPEATPKRVCVYYRLSLFNDFLRVTSSICLFHPTSPVCPIGSRRLGG